jgi:hypothetical protein
MGYRSKPQAIMDALVPLLERAELDVERVGVNDGTWDRRDVTIVVDHEGNRFVLEVRSA